MNMLTFKLFCWVYWLVIIKNTSCTNDLILSDNQNEETNSKTVDINSSVNKLEPFIATHEWQVVHDNQAIPAGLHVRMNFETDIKEAKILEEEKNKDNHKETEKSVPKIIISEDRKKNDDSPKDDDKIYFTKSDLKEALHEFRDKVGNKDAEDVSWDEVDLNKVVPNEEVKKKFRSIEEIRSELEHTMGWKIKSDMEIMKDHILLLQNDSKSVEETGATLDNLEFYVHQIDNGIDLVRVDKLKPIVLLLNHSSELIQEKAANVIGAASQSNPDVQNNVIHNGGMTLLLRMLLDGTTKLTKKKGLYALSAVVRGNTHAQQELVKYDGIHQILHLIQSEESSGSLKVKAVTLLFDLIVEQNEVLLSLVKQGKKKPADMSPLLNLLLDNGWCKLLPPLLKDDYDTVEKILQAIQVSVHACKAIFRQDPNTMKIFHNALQHLNKDIASEDDAEFKSYLLNLKAQLQNDVIAKL